MRPALLPRAGSHRGQRSCDATAAGRPAPERRRGRAAGELRALHGIGNLGISALFFSSYLLRQRDCRSRLASILSYGGLALATMTAWLGGELVDRLGISVSPTANPDAPSSLRARTELTQARVEDRELYRL